MKRTGIVLLLLLALVGALLARALLVRSPQLDAAAADAVAIDGVGAVQRLALAVTFETVSSEDGAPATAAFQGLHDFLAEAFPRVHRGLERERVADLSLLYTWRGRDPTLDPVLLMAHLDVVPVETGSEQSWTHPPFAGVVADGHVWGRGTMDDKVGVLGQLEAVEALLRDGFRPERTIHLAFGHDEELGGRRGAAAIAALLAARGEQLFLVLDEGMGIVDGVISGVGAPVALVGVAEKGYVNLELEARAAGGHSSVPPAETAVEILARALLRLDRHPMPARLDGPTAQLFDRLAPEMPLGRRFFLANRWLFGPLLRPVLARDPALAASMRTTLVPTLLDAGVKANVLPRAARAVLNARVHPADTIAAVEDHVRRVVDDPRLTLRRHGEAAVEASPISPTDGPAFHALESTLRATFPGVLVAPALVVGGTDAKHYVRLGRNVYRFTPMTLARADLARIHGLNERLAIDDYPRIIAFYYRLLERVAGSAPGSTSGKNPAPRAPEAPIRLTREIDSGKLQIAGINGLFCPKNHTFSGRNPENKHSER